MIASRFLLSLLFVSVAQAQGVPALYQGADLKLGESLIAKHQCDSCHQQKVGGDGSAVSAPGQGEFFGCFEGNGGVLRSSDEYRFVSRGNQFNIRGAQPRSLSVQVMLANQKTHNRGVF
jgi:hypothetical protein